MRPEPIWYSRFCPQGLITCAATSGVYIWAHHATDITSEGHIYYRSAHPQGKGVWLCLPCHQARVYEILVSKG